MANRKHVEKLKEGVDAWNSWRHSNPNITPDLSGTNLEGEYLPNINFNGANIRRANLTKAILKDSWLRDSNLRGAILEEATFSNANLKGADLSKCKATKAFFDDAYLVEAKLTEADLREAYCQDADFTQATLVKADLSGAFLSYAKFYKAKLKEANLERANCGDADFGNANLRQANLHRAILANAKFHWADLSDAIVTDAVLIAAMFIETNFENADLSRSWIYGVSTWNVNLKGAKQFDLAITSSHIDKAPLTVDRLEVAQFVYMLLNQERFREVIETITTKTVLILGRFGNRKIILDAIREEIRQHNYIPMMFDFEPLESRDLTETVMTLAGMARFVIADLSDPHSIPHELMSFVERLVSVPVQPIFCAVAEHPSPYPMFEHLLRYSHVLPIYQYQNKDQLILALPDEIIAPAETKLSEIRLKLGISRL